MTWVAQLFIRGALVWLALGVLLGGYLLAWPALGATALPYTFTVLHAHMLFVGFIVNMIMGVAYWMFPRPKTVPRREWLSVTAFGLLNVGLTMRVIFQPWQEVWSGGRVAGALVAVSALLQVVGVLLFIMQVWPRVIKSKQYPAKP